jgi:hypothetical protein
MADCRCIIDAVKALGPIYDEAHTRFCSADGDLPAGRRGAIGGLSKPPRHKPSAGRLTRSGLPRRFFEASGFGGVPIPPLK